MTSGVFFVYWGTTTYDPAMKAMEEAQKDRADGRIPDTIFYLEHEPVVTYGRATPREHLRRTDHSMPLVEVNRGGLATYHGFGQLVGYPVIDLKRRAGNQRPDIHDYLRALETGIAAYLGDAFGLTAGPVPGLTGVWLHDKAGAPRKIASVGISVRRWVTAHGFALNLAPDLTHFDSIVPCGLTNHEITSVARELDRRRDSSVPPTPRDAAPVIHRHLCAALHEYGWCIPENEQ